MSTTYSFNLKYWMEKYYNEMVDIEKTISIDLTDTCRLIAEISGGWAEIRCSAYLSKYEIVTREIEQSRSWFGFGKKRPSVTTEVKRYLPATYVFRGSYFPVTKEEKIEINRPGEWVTYLIEELKTIMEFEHNRRFDPVEGICG